ncbi:MAG TPA: sigma-70 family RNA polymerase sigma factor [Candidatus Cloacimonadota bacterium]|nr:sigma-70 family RNA polymerase sigma factor [Candidatus Cloacimonadota bacterium]HPK40941.1 sigma-70 family RNA polymerase sigma factor [Candidatus Cloacimonadota bacterium]
MDSPFDWEEFIKEKSKKLFYYVLKFVSTKEDAEDIVQSTFIKLLQNQHKLDEEYYERWIYRVAHNKSMNLLKKNKLIWKKTEEITLSTKAYTIDEYENKDEIIKQEIRKHFLRLKEKQALALELQFYQKKTYKEIANIMGLSVPAVESLLVRAKKEMKKNMQGF